MKFQSAFLVGAVISAALVLGPFSTVDAGEESPQADGKLLEEIKALRKAIEDLTRRVKALEKNTDVGGSGETRYQGKPASFWMRALSDRDEEFRGQAVDAVGKIGPEAGDVVPKLIGILKEDEYVEVRAKAARALGKFGKEFKVAITALVEIVKSREESATVRQAAVEGIGEIGPKAGLAVPLLIEVMTDEEDMEFRCAAVAALGMIGGEGRAIPALIGTLEQLKPEDYDHGWSGFGKTNFCQAVMKALGNSGPRSRDAIPALARALKSNLVNFGYSAASALGNIGAEAVPVLAEALADKSIHVRGAVVRALGDIGQDAKAALPGLIALKEELEVKIAAIKKAKPPEKLDVYRSHNLRNTLKRVSVAIRKIKGSK